MKLLHIITQNDTASAFIVTQFGNFTANFKAIPAPLPPEYWIPLYGVIITSIVGWSIPTIIGWAKARRQEVGVRYYHKRINSLYDDDKLDENDIKSLDKLKNDMTDAFAKGKISELHYSILKDKISNYVGNTRKSVDNTSSFHLTTSDNNIARTLITDSARSIVKEPLLPSTVAINHPPSKKRKKYYRLLIPILGGIMITLIAGGIIHLPGVGKGNESLVLSLHPNHPPVANAGPDRTVNQKTTVKLDGTSSYAPASKIVSYSWVQTTGSAVILHDANTATPYFITPEPSANTFDTTLLSFKLKVIDKSRSEDTAIVNIHVLPVVDKKLAIQSNTKAWQEFNMIQKELTSSNYKQKRIPSIGNSNFK